MPSRLGRLIRALVCVCAALALGAATALATVAPHPHVGKLAGFPVIRGVVPVLGSKAAIGAHERLVKNAFAGADARHAQSLKGSPPTPVPNEQPLASCSEEFEEELSFLTQDMCYRGGPVLHGPKIHLIFWQGPAIATPPAPGKFPAGYVQTVERYFEDVAHDSHAQTNVFAVDPQYGEQASGKHVSGEYALSFEGAKDVYEDVIDPLPNNCTDNTEFSQGPCVLDSDLQSEINTAALVKSWPTENLTNVYLVFTPPQVGSCLEEGECAYMQYCAYHGDFGGNGETPGNQTLYANLPYIGNVPGCDAGVHPNEALSSREEDHGGDAVIDTASHELNETITDPLGSQCNENASKAIVGCERNAWTDAIGQEVADKCLPPETTLLGLNGIYGEPLVEGLGVRSYNQVINGDHYWTQREWSNEAGLFEGACVQRIIQAAFTVSPGARATVPITVNGNASGAPGDPATYWVWDFGDGERVGTSNPTASHTYATPGSYLVTVTAYDAFGSSAWTAGLLEVAAAPPPTPPPGATVNTITVTTPPPAVLKYSVAQIAAMLGLPRDGAKLAATRTITLGHAHCPPACRVSLNMYAKQTVVSHKHRTTRRISIGATSMSIQPQAAASPSLAKTLTLTLNASGRRLLRKRHTLSVTLAVTVEGREGGVWVMQRTLTLTSSAHSARVHL